jgi:predicted O-methyltransferase YrrM
VLGKARIKRVIERVEEHILEADAHNIGRLLQRRALEQTADFVESCMPTITPHRDRFALYEATLKLIDRPGLCCEFGVFQGQSINFIAERLPDSMVYGFDSFEGLPEDWRPGIAAGHFKLNQLPRVRSNVRLIRGWFDQTLPAFLEQHAESAAYLHIDSDLYSSAMTVLDLFAPRIRPGTVIVFDEFFNYPGWKEGEFKAFQEFVHRYRLRFEYAGYASAAEQVAVIIR